jgi:hypothetical protein
VLETDVVMIWSRKNKKPDQASVADRVISAQFGKNSLPLAALITRPQSESQIGAGKS